MKEKHHKRIAEYTVNRSSEPLPKRATVGDVLVFKQQKVRKGK